eukprot:CAMPEP_0178961570 /NCGR_PEP_ID=MMETSP0789-20121207/13790_1 /TAXON_ID=3005 /ORGANISM="Rhizosolenia setigera, Strain CCMP 1694" /LENGTH=455 /DNA_ID=CAMNT_0020645439 /DNA_START=62 /DNA_END=1429 /DNA_ORIENTATION=+
MVHCYRHNLVSSSIITVVVLSLLFLVKEGSSFSSIKNPTTTKKISSVQRIVYQTTKATTTRLSINNDNKSRLSFATSETTDVSGTNSLADEEGEEEKAFQKRTKELCELRNIPFHNIKNARDLSSSCDITNDSEEEKECSTQSCSFIVKKNKLYRMGKVSNASHPEDTDFLSDIKTFIDLRSPTELKEDETLNTELVFDGVTNLLWRERSGKVKDLGKEGWQARKYRPTPTTATSETISLPDDDDDTNTHTSSKNHRRERHFVSLMNEFKYVKGTLSKLRKRDIARAVLKSPGAIVSRRVRFQVKDVFLSEINDGGLPMLNELLLRFGAPGIKYVLELFATEERHPIAFYCTAGKDRTGMLAAIVLSIMGVPEENIVEDYSLSANVYAEMGDNKAMVGALSQRNLDPKTFLGAPPQVMRDTLKNIKEQYGSVEGYLDWIGFGEEKREKLKKVLTA